MMTGADGRPTGLVLSWKQGTAGHLQINRPEKANAYNRALLGELDHALLQFEGDAHVATVVIRGAGERSFCAGADLDEMQAQDFSSALDLKSAQVFARVATFPKVTIAAINGAAVAGGLELALACDLRICSEQARFFFPETRLGLIPAAGGTQRLPQVVGVARAKELILGGRTWTAAEAHRYGLVSDVVPSERLMAHAQEWSESIGQRNRLALRLAKTAIDAGSTVAVGHVYEKVAEALLYQVKFGKGA